MNEIRILVVDDHPVVRAGILGMLQPEEDFQVVGEAEDGLAAVNKARMLNPQVVLMDLQMPRMNGVEATSEIKKINSEIQVLVLTTYDSDADILRAIEAGATGFLLKDTPRDALYRAIRGAARGEAVLAPVVAARLMKKVRTSGEEALSPREIEILEKVAEGCGNKKIAKDLFISEATVKSHLLNIYGKLAVSDRTAAVTKALKLGILRLK